MALGFGKTKSTDEIIVESMVKASNLDPTVIIKWGRLEGQLTPDEAVAHAVVILQAAAAAQCDSAVTKLFSSMEGFNIPKAALFRRMLRDFRNSELKAGRDLSGVRMVVNPNEEPVPVERVKGYGAYLLHTAVVTETEAFLVEYLRNEVGVGEERINQVLGELRAIMFPDKTEEESV